MQVLRLLVARRRAVSTITTAASAPASCECRVSEEDEGPFFDLDFSSPSSARAASCAASGSASSGWGSDDSDDESCAELDFVISLQRSRSASPSYEAIFFGGAAPLKLSACSDSEPAPAGATSMRRFGRRGGLRSLSFAANGRHSFARRSSSSARSLRLFAKSPAADEQEAAEAEPRRAAPSGDVIRRCLTKISRRFRTVVIRSPRAPAAVEARGLRRLRKCRSASAATVAAASRQDDSVLEKQDGIASAIAHCKESLHRASSVSSERDSSPLLRSKSDPGKCEAAA